MHFQLFITKCPLHFIGYEVHYISNVNENNPSRNDIFTITGESYPRNNLDGNIKLILIMNIFKYRALNIISWKLKFGILDHMLFIYNILKV